MTENVILSEDFYEKAISSIASGIGIQEFTEMCYDYFQLDIIIVDEGYQLLACAGRRPFRDPYWETLADSGSPEEKTIVNNYLKEGYLDAVANTANAVYIDWGICSNYPQTCAPVYVHGQLAGFLSLLCLELEKKDFTLKLNSILSRLYSILLQSGTFLKRQTQNPIREVFARQFFDTEHYPQAPDPKNYQPFLNIQPDFLLVVLRSENKAILSHVRGRLRSFSPNVIYFQQELFLYLFLYDLHGLDARSICSELFDFLEKYELKTGFSVIFTNIHKRALYIQQAESALKIGEIINPKKKQYYYPDYYIPSVLFEAVKKFFPENLIPPELLILQRFDKQNQTDYAESLRIYLYERNNLNRAASCLHLHRNTLKYRLDKISALLEISLDDPATAQRLQLGFQLLDFTVKTSFPNYKE